MADTFTNNVIALGNNITPKSWVKGIDITSSGVNTPFYFLNNTVNISSALTLNSTLSATGQNGAACFYRFGTAQNIYMYNNILSNQATQTGVGSVSAMTINGTAAQYFGNYNVFTAIGSNPVVTLGTTNNYTLSAWKTASGNDTSSTNAIVPFVSNSNLHIVSNDPGAWNVFGRGLANASLPIDADGNARSITTGIPTTAGAYEITTPTSVPNDVTLIPATPVAGTPTELWSNGRKVAEITWGAGATLPTAFTAKFYPGVQAPALNYSPNTNAYFDITQTGFTGSYTIKQYVNAAEAAGQAFSALRAAKRHNTDPYTFIATVGSNSMDANGAYLQSTAQTTFSTFGMTAGNTPLAIELKDISASNEGRNNRIDWSTASELASDVFELQSSVDGKLFNAIATLHATGTPRNYNYLDKNAANGITYYRLKTTGVNGVANFSKVVSAKVDANGTTPFSITPNPTSGMITIKSALPAGTNLTIEWRDITGRIVKSINTAESDVTTDMSGLQAGTYIVRVYNGSSVYATKVVKN